MRSEENTNDLIPLPPYVKPEHQALIDEATDHLGRYEGILWKSIIDRLIQLYGSMESAPKQALSEADMQFRADPGRDGLIKHLGHLKFLFECPRFSVKMGSNLDCRLRNNRQTRIYET